MLKDSCDISHGSGLVCRMKYRLGEMMLRTLADGECRHMGEGILPSSPFVRCWAWSTAKKPAAQLTERAVAAAPA